MEISLVSLLVKTVLEFFIEGQEAAHRPGDFNPNFITFFSGTRKPPTCHPIQRGKRKLFIPPHPGFSRRLLQADPAFPPRTPGPGPFPQPRAGLGPVGPADRSSCWASLSRPGPQEGTLSALCPGPASPSLTGLSSSTPPCSLLSQVFPSPNSSRFNHPWICFGGCS